MLSHCCLDFSVGVGAFVIGLSQIYSFFSSYGSLLSSFIQICENIDKIPRETSVRQTDSDGQSANL